MCYLSAFWKCPHKLNTRWTIVKGNRYWLWALRGSLVNLKSSVYLVNLPFLWCMKCFVATYVRYTHTFICHPHTRWNADLKSSAMIKESSLATLTMCVLTKRFNESRTLAQNCFITSPLLADLPKQNKSIHYLNPKHCCYLDAGGGKWYKSS